jgi:hypothetical protein
VFPAPPDGNDHFRTESEHAVRRPMNDQLGVRG